MSDDSVRDEPGATYGVYVSGLRGSAAEFEHELVAQGMSEARAREVVGALPCFVKRDVPLDVARAYETAFQRAGAWVSVENWATTTNPAAYQSARRAPLELPLPPPKDVPRLPRNLPRGTVPAEPGPPRAIDVKPIIVQREHWAKRYAPSGIAILVLFVLATYPYGCQKVTRQELLLKESIDDVSVAMGNLNAKGYVVTDADIVASVQSIGDEIGLDIERDEITIDSEDVVVVRSGNRCEVRDMPVSVAKLPMWERDRLLANIGSCHYPRHVVRVHIAHRARVGLYAQTLDFTRYMALDDYRPD